MTQYMPTEILGKVVSEKIPDIQSIASDAEIGYILEVDLEVPMHLHDFFADYPLAPEKQIVSENWLSLYNERLIKYDNLAKNYGDYLKKLRAEKDLNNYIKTLAVKMFPKKEKYTKRLENYHKRYEDNDLYSSLEELYKLYYHIAKEENRERSDDEIEQMLKEMAI
ncbi:19273_t:CDS:2 [Funneliformis geosporum]|uniref:19273_t:CDS:1 n=1 Tax=Funneliformis geosporum TaxID=1117311 RepID=A0A9W4SYQ5_9GLOM|nr:19273_t:CDS:2 [Funneliformis geosporum]